MHLDAQEKASNRTIWRRPGVWLALILALSTALRLGVAFYLGDATPPGKDETSYSVLAARLAAGHGYSFSLSLISAFKKEGRLAVA